jgi:hypothetical protein
MAQAKLEPTATSLKVPAGGVLSAQVLPQHCNTPAAATAHAWNGPTDRAVKLPLGELVCPEVSSPQQWMVPSLAIAQP